MAGPWAGPSLAAHGPFDIALFLAKPGLHALLVSGSLTDGSESAGKCP